MKQMWRCIEQSLERWYQLHHGRELVAENRRRHDTLMLLVYSDALGIDNPAAHHLLELKVLLVDDFHDWHRRAGLDHCVLDCTRCC